MWNYYYFFCNLISMIVVNATLERISTHHFFFCFNSLSLNLLFCSQIFILKDIVYKVSYKKMIHLCNAFGSFLNVFVNVLKYYLKSAVIIFFYIHNIEESESSTVYVAHISKLSKCLGVLRICLFAHFRRWEYNSHRQWISLTVWFCKIVLLKKNDVSCFVFCSSRKLRIFSYVSTSWQDKYGWVR